MRSAPVLFFCASTLLAAEPSAPPADAPLVIGMRKTASGKVWLQRTLSDAAFMTESAEVARLLANDKLDPLDKTLLIESVERDRLRAANAFSACLNFRKCGDPNTRLGALRGIEIATASQQDFKNASFRAIGKSIAAVMLAEPVPHIRTAALQLVRDHKDDAVTAMASASLVEFWRGAFDSDGLINEGQRDAALAALRELGDKRTYQALLYYATIEVHTGTAAPVGVDTVNIRGNQINLPIDLPSNNVMSFDATLIVPAVSALKHVTGQEFGKNIAKWREWINAQPDFKKN